LVECVRNRWTLARAVWVVFFLLVPIAPAVIYLMFTRSRTFQGPLSHAQTRS
jgi:hypothetical protein